MREFVNRAIKQSLESVRADRVCESFCKIKKNELKAGKIEYELGRFKRKYLVAVGKAACPMAKHLLSGIEFDGGLISTDKQCDVKIKGIEVFRASHPLPNLNSVKAAEYLIELAEASKRDDLFVFLISGGASSLIEKPKMDLEEYKRVINYMLLNDFPIEEINLVRKALSRIKGGKILKLIKGEVASFVISDVIGDDLSVIGSGLTYYDRFSRKDFVEVCSKLKEFNVCRYDYDSLTKDEFLFKRVTNHIIASNSTICSSLVNYFTKEGYSVLNLGSYLKGRVEWVADILFDTFKKAISGTLGIKKPFAIVFGGEPTVEVKGDGKGGRCQHLAAMMAIKLMDMDGEFAFVSFATDGKDGNSDFSGAIVDREVLSKCKEEGIKIDDYLKDFNSAAFFERVGGAIPSFDTLTNVADVGFFLFK